LYISVAKELVLLRRLTAPKTIAIDKVTENSTRGISSSNLIPFVKQNCDVKPIESLFCAS
jgi:hypothetical protein